MASRISMLLVAALIAGCADHRVQNGSSSVSTQQDQQGGSSSETNGAESPSASTGTAVAANEDDPGLLPLDQFPATEEGWRAKLSEEQFYVTREEGTEYSFRNKYWDNKKHGLYRCVCCGQKLFNSETKYESGTGWPSFYQPVAAAAVAEKEDNTLFATRTEVECSRCGAHLGHVFNDGPQPTGLRYCMNSAALNFEEQDVAGPKDEKAPVEDAPQE